MTESFSQAWNSTLQALLQRGSGAGADLVEVFLEHTDHLGLLAEQERITSVNPTFARGAGIRVFLDGRDGFVSTQILGIEPDLKFLKCRIMQKIVSSLPTLFSFFDGVL